MDWEWLFAGAADWRVRLSHHLHRATARTPLSNPSWPVAR
jgi:hypothetical protein